MLNTGRRIGLIVAPNDRPTTCALHSEGQYATATFCVPEGPSLRGRYQQSPKATEAVRVHETQGHELCQRIFNLGAQHARTLDEFIEKQRAMRRETVEQDLSLRARQHSTGGTDER